MKRSGQTVTEGDFMAEEEKEIVEEGDSMAGETVGEAVGKPDGEPTEGPTGALRERG